MPSKGNIPRPLSPTRRITQKNITNNSRDRIELKKEKNDIVWFTTAAAHHQIDRHTQQPSFGSLMCFNNLIPNGNEDWQQKCTSWTI
jgi:hypothetical protein